MTDQRPSGWAQAVWRLALGALAVAFVLNLAWALLIPLLPVLVVAGVGLAAWRVWQARRGW